MPVIRLVNPDRVFSPGGGLPDVDNNPLVVTSGQLTSIQASLLQWNTSVHKPDTALIIEILDPTAPVAFVSGNVNAYDGLMEFSINGDLNITPVGGEGTEIAIAIVQDDDGGHAVTVVGGDQQPITDTQPNADTLIYIARWPRRWRVRTAEAMLPAVATPTFDPATDWDNSAPNGVTIPTDVGIQYKLDGVNIAAGTTSSIAAGAHTLTAVPLTGYGIPGGTTTSWNHTFPALPGWTVWDRMTFTAANGTAVTAVATDVGGRHYTSLSGAAFVDSNHVKRDGSGSDNNVTLNLTGLPGTHMRQSVDYNLSDRFPGYVPAVRLAGGLTTGTIKVSVEWGDATHATITTNTDFSGVPTIVYESGQGATGHPITGTLMVEYNPTTHLVLIYINGVLIGTIDTSGFTYLGSPNPMTLTGVQVIGADAYYQFDNHLIEVLT